MSQADFSRKTLIRANPTVLYREIEGESVLLEPDEGAYFTLNETGTVVWNLIEETVSLEQVLNALVETYDVSPDRAWAELEDLLRALDVNGLVEIIDD